MTTLHSCNGSHSPFDSSVSSRSPFFQKSIISDERCHWRCEHPRERSRFPWQNWFWTAPESNLDNLAGRLQWTCCQRFSLHQFCIKLILFAWKNVRLNELQQSSRILDLQGSTNSLWFLVNFTTWATLSARPLASLASSALQKIRSAVMIILRWFHSIDPLRIVSLRISCKWVNWRTSPLAETRFTLWAWEE